MLGTGTGAVVVPPLAQRLIAMRGWRAAYALSGCAVLLVTLPVVSLLLRGDPREKGLLPDGVDATDAPDAAVDSRGTSELGLSWNEVWRRPEFWTLIGSFFFASASVHACILHMSALLTDRGVSAQAAAATSSLVGVALLFGRFGAGYLLDKFFAPRLAMIFLGASTLGIAVLLSGAAGTLALLAAFLVGLGFGSEVDIITYSLTRYFGLKAFGTAYGYAFGAFLVAGALGSFLMGAGFDWTHSYRVPLAGFLTSMLLAVWMMTRLGPYRFAAGQGESEPAAGAVPVESLG
jgi:cyanate permease